MTDRNAVLLADARSVRRRIAKLREEEPVAAEIFAINSGSKEFRDGNFTGLSELRGELGRRRRH